MVYIFVPIWIRFVIHWQEWQIPKQAGDVLNETWNVIENASKLGGPDWFHLGDQDLGTHLERTRRLKEGQTLTQITRDFCKAWGIEHTVLPMSDQPVRTIVETDEGELAFQEYFVHRRCEPRVKGFRFDGVDTAEPAPGAREAIQSADAVIICPSNPWVSIDPILKVISQRDREACNCGFSHHWRSNSQRPGREDVSGTGNRAIGAGSRKSLSRSGDRVCVGYN